MGTKVNTSYTSSQKISRQFSRTTTTSLELNRDMLVRSRANTVMSYDKK